MANELEILIKTTADKMGITLTQDGIDKIKNGLNNAGKTGEDAFDRMGRGSFRMKQRVESSIVSILGMNSPLQSVTSKFDYLSHVAAGLDLSVGQMLIKFGPMVAITAGLGVVFNQLKGIADSGKQMFEDARSSSSGWLDNIKAGLGIVKQYPPEYEKSAVFAERITAAAKEEEDIRKRKIRDAGQPTTFENQLKDQATDIQTKSDKFRKLNEDKIKGLEEQRKGVGALDNVDLIVAYKARFGEVSQPGDDMSGAGMRKRLKDDYDAQIKKAQAEGLGRAAQTKADLDKNAQDQIDLKRDQEMKKARQERNDEGEKYRAERVARGLPAYQPDKLTPQAPKSLEERREERLRSVEPGSRAEASLLKTFAAEDAAKALAASKILPNMSLNPQGLGAVSPKDFALSIATALATTGIKINNLGDLPDE